MNGLLEKIAEILEVDINDLNENTDFRLDVPGWDSMKGFSTICMIEDEYRIRISVPEFLDCKTIGDLWTIVNSSRK